MSYPSSLSGDGKNGSSHRHVMPRSCRYSSLLVEAGKIADAVVGAVEKRLDVRFVDDRVLVPERIVGELHGSSVR